MESKSWLKKFEIEEIGTITLIVKYNFTKSRHMFPKSYENYIFLLILMQNMLLNSGINYNS